MEVIHEPKVVWNLSTKLVEMINEWLQGSLNSLARVINDDKVALDLFLADHLWVYLAMPQASGKVNTGLHGRKPPGFLEERWETPKEIIRDSQTVKYLYFLN